MPRANRFAVSAGCRFWEVRGEERKKPVRLAPEESTLAILDRRPRCNSRQQFFPQEHQTHQVLYLRSLDPYQYDLSTKKTKNLHRHVTTRMLHVPGTSYQILTFSKEPQQQQQQQLIRDRTKIRTKTRTFGKSLGRDQVALMEVFRCNKAFIRQQGALQGGEIGRLVVVAGKQGVWVLGNGSLLALFLSVAGLDANHREQTACE